MVPVQRPLLLPAFHGSRYQAQDVFGQTSYGYAYPGQTANDYHDPFSNRIGSYAYVNPAGKEVRVSYTADARGFHVLSNDLPVAVQDTPEVATAKIEHAKALNAASSRAKRQIAVYPTKQFVNDLHYRSVYLNKDGQHDVPFYPAYHSVLPFATHVAAPFVAPVLTKTTLKTVTAEADLSAPTPAATNLLELKEGRLNSLQ